MASLRIWHDEPVGAPGVVLCNRHPAAVKCLGADYPVLYGTSRLCPDRGQKAEGRVVYMSPGLSLEEGAEKGECFKLHSIFWTYLASAPHMHCSSKSYLTHYSRWWACRQDRT